jgi:hypothetical protein
MGLLLSSYSNESHSSIESHKSPRPGLYEYEIHEYHPEDIVDLDLIHRMDRTSYLLRNKLIKRYRAHYISISSFTVTKVHHTDDWIIKKIEL